ncbi:MULTISPECIES: hypothetical protein [unclassified Kribbella]|uniref:hypothetical protein n=1 Tax=unclassified Kribbella TaxID=2644121 RepID=UPI00301917E8
MLRISRSRDKAGRRLLVVLAVAVAVALVVGVTTVLVLREDEQVTPSGPGPVPSSTTTGTATTKPPTAEPTSRPTPRPSASTSPTRPSAVAALEPFLSSAATLDRQLRAAAAAINASGPPWTDVSPTVARAVRAADLDPVAGAIPAGMPHDLLQSVILVLSDLSSRRSALTSFQSTPPAAPHDTTAGLLRELRNGHAAAVRFDRDLAATRALAAATPPIAELPKQSRRTAEVLLLVRYVQTANAGCDSRGGAVFTRLPAITWGPVAGTPEVDGTIGGIAFSAALDADDTWNINLFAC